MARPNQGLEALLSRVAGSAAFAYSSLVLIQARVMWGIWSQRDLSAGDSAEHFERAAAWARQLELDALFSPLYSVLLGSLLWAIDDAYATMISHRVLIAVAVAVLVLVLLRRLLTPAIAWLLAVWWALLPVNYDTATEVHLFAAIPLLAAAAIAASHQGRAARSLVLGVLLAGAVLVRTELVIAAAAWAAIWGVYELKAAGRAERRPPLRPVLLAFAAPVLVSTALGGLAILADDDRSVSGDLAEKDSSAFCQHYAVGWQQRHGDFSQTGWARCHEYAQRDFDEHQPSMLEALAANPGAVAGHYRWNASLVPFGVQLSLLGRTSGPADRNPDYLPAETGSSLALAASVALLVLLALGASLLWRDRSHWWREWVRPRAWGWAALASTALMGLYVMLVIRPRPAYLFGLTVVLLAVAGMCAMAIVRRRPQLARLRAAVPLLALAALVAAPSHYRDGYETPQLGPGRPLKSAVERLEPLGARLAGEDTSLMARHPIEICSYLRPKDPCTGVPLAELAERPAGSPASDRLAEMQIGLVYLGEEDFAAGLAPQEVRLLEQADWRIVAAGGAPPAGWVLLGAPAGARGTRIRLAP
ncbi:MAG: hypothetical protein ACXWZW_12340 [Solirubrobacterales bacterium]